MKKAGKHIVFTAAVLIAVVAFLSGIASAEIKFGTLPRLSAAEQQAMFKPLLEYLTIETGEKVTLVIPKSFDAFKDEVKAGHMDLGFVNPLVYVQVKKNVNVEPLALSSELKTGARLRGIIIVRKYSGIRSLQDLKGKKFSFMDKDSPAGYVFQMLLLSRAGLDVHKDITILPFAKRHENVAMAVFDKTADAGGLREDELEKVKDKLDVSQLEILAYTDFFPNWPVFATPKLKKETAEKVRAALLKLNPLDPKSLNILGPARLTGFVPISDKEYDDLREAAKIAGAL